MLQALSLDADTRCWSRTAGECELPDDCWPEVSTRYSRENPAPFKPENAQGRVVLEIFLLSAGAAIAVAAVLFLLPPGLAQ